MPGALAAGVAALWVLGDLGVVERLLGASATTALVTVGLATLVEQLVRQQGKRKEPGLWEGWGGPPATRTLRHRETQLSNPVKRAAYHQKLKRLIRDIRIPTQADEERDPSAADHVYDRCIEFLKTKTRDRERFRLVFEENINYGFCRNLWAMWPAGLLVAALGTAASAYLVTVAAGVNNELFAIALVVTVVNATFLVWWLFRINRALVFMPARAWSERIFEALDEL